MCHVTHMIMRVSRHTHDYECVTSQIAMWMCHTFIRVTWHILVCDECRFAYGHECVTSHIWTWIRHIANSNVNVSHIHMCDIYTYYTKWPYTYVWRDTFIIIYVWCHIICVTWHIHNHICVTWHIHNHICVTWHIHNHMCDVTHS